MPTSHDRSIFSWLSGNRHSQPLIISLFQARPPTGFSTGASQLELFADLVWILSDPASVNRPRIDHRGIGEPAGSGRPHDEPALRPVAMQHHRVAKQCAGGALVQQCTLRVQVVGVPGWYPEVYPEVQQQHHRFLEGDPSGPRSAHRFRSHALLVGNIQHKTAADQSCTGCDGWPKRRAPQEMKCSSVSGAGRRRGGERDARRGGELVATGGAILVARNASGSDPRPVSVARGPGAGCS